MENFKSTYRPMLFFMIILAIVVFAATSCKTPTQHEQARGLDRLMVEECDRFEIIPSKGIAIDTSISTHPYKWRYAYYKLNADSTRYIMCK